jgi:ribosomal protein S18 acetylase RimI-like enzyme
LSPSPDARLVPLTEADFATVAQLGATIWHEHYTPIVGRAQIEYMLAGRYAPEKLRLYLGATDRWFELLVVDGEPVGYCSYALTPPDEMKLEQLYCLASMRGRGLGGMMLRHVEGQAKKHGRPSVWLTVNRGNAGSIAIYRKAGFTVREEAVFDIGNGFVMDDYVMVKRL